MKKAFLTCTLLALLLVSCKQNSKTEVVTEASSKNTTEFSKIYNSKELIALNTTITDPTQKLQFYKHLYLVTTFENLKNTQSKKIPQLKIYSDKVLIQLSELIIAKDASADTHKDLNANAADFSGPTGSEINKKLDSILSTKTTVNDEIMRQTFTNTPLGGTKLESVNGDIVTIMRDFGTGSSVVYTYAMVENDSVTNLKQVYNYLDESEYTLLKNTIKKQVPKYDYNADRVGTEIKKTKDNTYNIGFRAYTTEDAGCCSSIAVSYDTKDFKTIIPNTIKVKKD